jgi:hypothetical protein
MGKTPFLRSDVSSRPPSICYGVKTKERKHEKALDAYAAFV